MSSYSYESGVFGLHLPQHQLKQQQQHRQQQQPVAQKQNIIKNLHHLLFANKYALKFSSPNCSANWRPMLPYWSYIWRFVSLLNTVLAWFISLNLKFKNQLKHLIWFNNPSKKLNYFCFCLWIARIFIWMIL